VQELTTFRCATGAAPASNDEDVHGPRSIGVVTRLTTGETRPEMDWEGEANSQNHCDLRSERDNDEDEFIENSGDWLADWRTAFDMPSS
jgi:hypothetical protein